MAAWKGWEKFAPPESSDAPPVRRSKYNAQPIIRDGIRFHSKREANRWTTLRALERVKLITNLRPQVVFPLTCTSRRSDHTVVVGSYICDFVYQTVPAGDTIVEDVKGVRTDLYRWKRKHFEAEYGVTILET